MERTPITREGFQRLRDELDRLKRIERPTVIQEIKEARSHGDLSENAEYHAAREKQGIIEAKIRDIETKLASSEILECPAGPKKKVIFGCRVKLEDLDTGEIAEYRIVGPFEADIHLGLLSVTSPIARALIGKTMDDDITVEAPGNTKEYEILEIGD
ncbi:transcription elongation factor GreA [bacterium]|nr:MAG: transcription elongation factor GreA [bacterium]